MVLVQKIIKREIRKKKAQDILLLVLSINAFSFQHLCTRFLVPTVTIYAALEIGSTVATGCILYV